MSTIIAYRLNQKGQKASLLDGGDGKRDQVVKLDTTPELAGLADSIDQDGNAYIGIGGELDLYRGELNFRDGGTPRIVKRVYADSKYYGCEPTICYEKDSCDFDAPLTLDAALKWKRDYNAKLAAMIVEAKKELPAAIEKWKAAQAERKAADEAREARNKAEQAAAKERREKEAAAADAAKAAWIAEYGSEFLKKAHGAGYDCQRRYVTERAAIEYPDLSVDFDDEYEWKSRSCPSEEALDLALSIKGAEVVWFTDGPADSEDEYGEKFFTKREGIVVKNFLGNYTLVK